MELEGIKPTVSGQVCHLKVSKTNHNHYHDQMDGWIVLSQ